MTDGPASQPGPTACIDGTKEEVLKEYRVGQILEAARRVIARFGFEGTTVDRVAKAARIAKGTIYLYFPRGKDELLHSAQSPLVDGIRDLTGELRRIDDATAPPIERIANLIRGMFSIQHSHEDLFTALILDARIVNYEEGDWREPGLKNVYVELLEYLAAVLRCAMEQGAITTIDPQLTAFRLSEMITAVFRRRLLGLTSDSSKADEEAVLEMFLHGVRGIRRENHG